MEHAYAGGLSHRSRRPCCDDRQNELASAKSNNNHDRSISPPKRDSSSKRRSGSHSQGVHVTGNYSSNLLRVKTSPER